MELCLAGIPKANHPAPIRPDAKLVPCKDCRCQCWLGPRQLALYEQGWIVLCPKCTVARCEPGDSFAMIGLGG